MGSDNCMPHAVSTDMCDRLCLWSYGRHVCIHLAVLSPSWPISEAHLTYCLAFGCRLLPF